MYINDYSDDLGGWGGPQRSGRTPKLPIINIYFVR